MLGDVTAERSAKIGGLCGIVAGIAFIVEFFSFPLGPQNQTAEQSLASFGTYRNVLILEAALSVLSAFFLFPYLLAMRDALKGKDRALASPAATFVIITFVIITTIMVVSFAIQASMSDVYVTGTAQEKATAIVVEKAVQSLSFLPLEGAAFGAGMLLFGIAMRGSKTFPNWAGYVGILSGLVALVGVVTSGFFITFVVFFITFLVWLFASSFFLWRSSGRPTVA